MLRPVLPGATDPVGVVGYTDAGVPCGESHPRAHLPDCIVDEIRDRRENRESVRSILVDLRAREYRVGRSQVYRVAEYQCRAAVPFRVERSSRLRDARTAAGMTTEALARAASVCRLSLLRYELRRRVPSAAVLARLAASLGVDPAIIRG